MNQNEEEIEDLFKIMEIDTDEKRLPFKEYEKSESQNKSESEVIFTTKSTSLKSNKE